MTRWQDHVRDFAQPCLAPRGRFFASFGDILRRSAAGVARKLGMALLFVTPYRGLIDYTPRGRILKPPTTSSYMVRAEKSESTSPSYPLREAAQAPSRLFERARPTGSVVLDPLRHARRSGTHCRRCGHHRQKFRAMLSPGTADLPGVTMRLRPRWCRLRLRRAFM